MIFYNFIIYLLIIIIILLIFINIYNKEHFFYYIDNVLAYKQTQKKLDIYNDVDLSSYKGDDGDKGDNGNNGLTGIKGDDGNNGKDSNHYFKLGKFNFKDNLSNNIIKSIDPYLEYNNFIGLIWKNLNNNKPKSGNEIINEKLKNFILEKINTYYYYNLNIIQLNINEYIDFDFKDLNFNDYIKVNNSYFQTIKYYDTIDTDIHILRGNNGANVSKMIDINFIDNLNNSLSDNNGNIVLDNFDKYFNVIIPHGDKGENGNDAVCTHSKGIDGPKGDDGYQGPRGPTGPKGDKGDPGKNSNYSKDPVFNNMSLLQICSVNDGIYHVVDNIQDFDIPNLDSNFIPNAKKCINSEPNTNCDLPCNPNSNICCDTYIHCDTKTNKRCINKTISKFIVDKAKLIKEEYDIENPDNEVIAHIVNDNDITENFTTQNVDPLKDFCKDKFVFGNKGPKGDDGDIGDIGNKGNKGLDGIDAKLTKEIPNIIFKDMNSKKTIGLYDGYNNTNENIIVNVPNGPTGYTSTIPNLNFHSTDLDDQNYMAPHNTTGADHTIKINLDFVKGQKGDKGNDGICCPGLRGIRGPIGDTGPIGLQGPKGDKGDPGNDAKDVDFPDNIDFNLVLADNICFNNSQNNNLCLNSTLFKYLTKDFLINS